MAATASSAAGLPNDCRPASTRPGNASPAALTTESWQSAGTGTFTDDVLPGVFGALASSTYSVEVEADAANKGMYRIVMPYASHPSYDNLDAAGYIPHTDVIYHLTIDATDPDNVIIPPSFIGLHIADGDAMLYSYSWLAANGDPDITEAYVDKHHLRGTLRDGIITFSTSSSLWLTTPELDKDASGWNVNPHGAFKLVLPGAADYSIQTLTEGWCADSDNRLIVSAWCGPDASYAKFAAVTDPDDEDAVKGALEKAERVTPRQGTYITLPAGCGPRQKVYIIGCSYDKNGVERGRHTNFCYIPDTSTDWERLPAQADFTDDIVSNLFSDIDLGTYTVDVERSTTRPGLFRLVNPYLGTPHNTIDGYHGAHSHYIYVDATDPDCVVLEESPIGMGTIDDGHITVTSQAYRALAGGATINEVKQSGKGGVMRDNIITFPEPTAIVAAFHSDGAAHWYYVNYTRDNAGNITEGRMRIDLRKALAGISDITADSRPAIYYNLQGMRIARPVEGQTYIVRRGTATTKEICLP